MRFSIPGELVYLPHDPEWKVYAPHPAKPGYVRYQLGRDDSGELIDIYVEARYAYYQWLQDHMPHQGTEIDKAVPESLREYAESRTCQVLCFVDGSILEYGAHAKDGKVNLQFVGREIYGSNQSNTKDWVVLPTK